MGLPCCPYLSGLLGVGASATDSDIPAFMSPSSDAALVHISVAAPTAFLCTNTLVLMHVVETRTRIKENENEKICW